MTQNAHVIQQPTLPAAQLILLFHGVDANPQSMLPLGQQLAEAFPSAMVVSVAAHQRASNAGGFEWFSVQGITEENRPARVAQAMPAFAACVAHWQQVAGVAADATALVGFSQGAIMALESTQHSPRLASRVFALSGRFATLPQSAPEEVSIHFLHGKADGVIAYGYAVEAAHHLVALGGDITAEVLPHIGHEVHEELIALVISKLSSHVPKRMWEEAQKANRQS